MAERLEQEREKLLLESVPETIRMILSEYLSKSNKLQNTVPKITYNNKALYKKILKLKDFGRKTGGIDWHESIGYNFKFTDLQAVVGIEQMKKLEWRVRRKKEMYMLYTFVVPT